ncbi:MAG: hypothetical protein EHM85_00815 [Desulfobacteraceae bacterium]|nr:MAG: hypothetical protein EHM85_00815 [Desulfobacteraceae bacterium]
MPKLTKQQIIILSIMAVAILYGIYDFYIVPRTKTDSLNPGEKTAEVEAFMADVTAKMTKGSLSAAAVYAINRAETEWQRDPFYEKKSFSDWKMFKEPKAGKDSKAEPGFNYSGYLKLDKKEMVIINGVEYESGSNMEIEGYVLEKIYPDRIVIVNKKSRSRVEVPLQE